MVVLFCFATTPSNKRGKLLCWLGDVVVYNRYGEMMQLDQLSVVAAPGTRGRGDRSGRGVSC